MLLLWGLGLGGPNAVFYFYITLPGTFQSVFPPKLTDGQLSMLMIKTAECFIISNFWAKGL